MCIRDRILGVQFSHVSCKDNAGSRVVQSFCVSAEGTDVPMQENPVVNTYESFQTCIDNDLVTGSQFIATRFDGTQWLSLIHI